jgi:hypothetical protein
MSFEEMNINELRDVAREFGVDIEKIKTKTGIAGALATDGVTYEMYNTISLAEKVELEPEVVEPKNEVKAGVESLLVRMERENGIYETRGVTFTREHPYALVDVSTAQDIFDNEEGFRPATPRELQEFYS